MTLVNAQDFLLQLASSDGFRTCYIKGVYGRGKTLVSVAIAYELWSQHFVNEISANFPLHGVSNSDSPTDFVMILDETSRVLSNRGYKDNEVTTWLNDLRKRNVIVLMPSQDEIDKKLRKFQVKRVFAFGLFLWVYQYFKLDPDKDNIEKLGTFFLLKPSKYFDAYPTKFQPSKADFEFARQKMAMGSDFSYLDNEAAWKKVTKVQDVPVQNKRSKLSLPRILRLKGQKEKLEKTLVVEH